MTIAKPENYTNPVLDETGKLENFTVRIEGKFFRCNCRCNVFHKPDKNHLELYKCNACGQTYEAE